MHVARCFDCNGRDPIRLYIDDRQIIPDNATAAQATTAPSRQITHTLKQPFTLPIPAHTTSAWTWNTVAKTKACVWNG